MFNNYKNGFSLIELIVSIAIVAIVMVVVSNFQVNVLRFNKYSKDVLESSQDAKAILRVMVKEMRSITPSNNGSYPIVSAGTSTLTFYSDINDDGLIDQVRYYLSTTTLKKGVIIPSGSPLTYNSLNEQFSTLAYNIKNGTSTALFEYYDTNYAGTSTPLSYPLNTTAVRLVRVNLLIDADPNRSPVPRLYTSTATLRNLKDNL